MFSALVRKKPVYVFQFPRGLSVAVDLASGFGTFTFNSLED